MKKILVLLVTLSMLLTVSGIAAADIIKVTPEVYASELSGDTYNKMDIDTFGATLEIDSLLLRFGANYYTGESDDNIPLEYKNTGAWLGVELGIIPKITPMVYVGWQDFRYESGSDLDKINGAIIGASVEYEINDYLSVRGRFEESLDMDRETRFGGSYNETDVDYSGIKADLIFYPAPLVDVFVGYRYKEFRYRHRLDEQKGFAAGVRVGF